MARTPEGQVLTRVHRAREHSLTATVLQDLVRLWQAIVDPTDFSTFQRFAEVAATLIGLRRRDAAGLAAAYYEQFRAAEQVAGAATVVMAAPLAEAAVRDEVAGAAIAGMASGRKAGQSYERAAQNAFVQASGTATRLVLSGSRETLTGSIRRDGRALGWLRITSADPCPWCRMLASRGPEYKSRATAGFQAHGHCACEPEPFYRGSQMPELNQRFEDEWKAAQRWARESGTASEGTSNDALNNFRRFLADRG